MGVLGGNRRGLGSIRKGSREPKQAVAPSPRSCLSLGLPACLSVCLSRLVSSDSLQTQQPVSLLSGA